MRRRAMLLALAGFSFLWIAVRRWSQAPPRARPAAAGAAALSEDGLIVGRPDLPPGQAAILLLAPDQKALAAASALESAGVPFAITRDPAAAARHRLIVIPFAEERVPLTAELLDALRRFLERGGVLVAQAPSSKDPWAELTGLARSQPSRRRKRILLDPAADPGWAGLSAAELREVPLAAAASPGPWTRGLQTRPALQAQVVASFDTGEAAVLRRRVGAGRVYTLGFDLRDVVLRPHAGRSFEASRVDQGLEPAADVWALALLGWYRTAAGDWARARAAPGRAPVTLALSHAVENAADETAAAALEAAERAAGARSTWFFRTGFDGSHEEASTLNPRVMETARRLAAAGHEVASHGVLHALDVEAFAEGAAPERPEDYRPELGAHGRSRGATLAGETSVSRRRLQRALGAAAAQGFRAPGLAYPTALASALENAGYLYDSSLTQRDALSARPFRLPAARRFEAETSVIELPVAFDDEQKQRRPDPIAVSLALERASAYEGLVVWALRPSARAAEDAVRQVLARMPAGAKVWRLVDAARFWRARSAARFALSARGSQATLTLELPMGAADLAFEVSRSIRSCRSALQVSCSGRVLVVNAAPGAAGVVSLSLD